MDHRQVRHHHHDAVIEALVSADGEEWLSGPISFTDKNTLARSYFIVLKDEGGKWVLANQ